ncbi:MAG: FHA domain-containing protein [Sphingomonas fennica]
MSLLLSLVGSDRAPPVRLAEGRDIVIGRAAEADMVLPDPTQQVSSRHAAIRNIAGRWMIADTSTNGTSVNGEAVRAPRPLVAGDVIRIGGYDIAVSEAAAAPAAAASATPTAALVAGVHRLLAVRTRQVAELGARPSQRIAANPFAAADPKAAAAALAALPAPAAADAVQAAIDAIDRHNAAALKAMQAALRETIATLAPERAGLADDFPKTFARAFRTSYEQLSADA